VLACCTPVRTPFQTTSTLTSPARSAHRATPRPEKNSITDQQQQQWRPCSSPSAVSSKVHPSTHHHQNTHKLTTHPPSLRPPRERNSSFIRRSLPRTQYVLDDISASITRIEQASEHQLKAPEPMKLKQAMRQNHTADPIHSRLGQRSTKRALLRRWQRTRRRKRQSENDQPDQFGADVDEE